MADIFQIIGKISLDGIDKAEKELNGLSDTGEKSASKLSRIGGVAKTFGKGLLLGTGAIATAGVGLVKQVSASYGALQQSIGGIETLFGKSAQKVIDNANNAYTTAGISANEYMQQVTSFSASLLQSLGGDTEKAANAADMAVKDMADNANKMGTSMEMIQNAYQGFSKQNYTMLDNLKLGYGGTKTEMERLLKDAEKISGIEYDITNLNDVYQAIHVIQGELGITGTTALEAGETIEGSFNSLSASWENFIAGLGNPDADMGKLVENLAKGIEGAITNVIPVINNMVSVLPTVVGAITDGIKKMLPNLIETFSKLITQIIEAIVDLLPTAIPLIVDCLLTVTDAIIKSLPQIIDAIVNALPTIIDSIVEFLINSLPQILDGAIQLLMGLVDAIPTIVEKLIDALPQIIDGITNFLTDSLPQIIDGAIKMFMGLVDAIPDIIDALVKALPQIIKSIINFLLTNIPVLIDGAIKMFMALVQAIPTISVELIKALPQIIVAIFQGLADLPSQLWNFFVGIWDNIKNVFSGVGNFFKGVFSGAWDLIKSAWSGVKSFFSGIWDGIKSIFSGVANWFGDVFDGVISAIKAPINWAIDALNFLISGLNKLSFDIPDWVPGIGGSHFGFDIPEIPYLAKGGIVDEPTVATIGEDGKEAVVPLENNLEWITNLAQKLISEFKSIIVPNNEVDKGINNIVTDDYIKPYQVSFDNQFNTLNDSIDRLIGLINEHLPNIANNMDREIVLDSGALAVGMSRKIDLQLGKISKSKGRGNV